MTHWNQAAGRIAAALVLTLGVAACGSSSAVRGATGSATRIADDTPAIGVNSFLWRATLDTIDFMPLASADPFGGVIVTDWYVNPEEPSERFKATVYILDSRLRADGLKVNIFRQAYQPGPGWIDQQSDPDTGLEIENAILTKARQLRIATLSN